MKLIRQLKVYSQLKDSEDKNSTYPIIKLRGDWLEKAGFNVNDKITVQIHKGWLTITKEEIWKQYPHTQGNKRLKMGC